MKTLDLTNAKLLKKFLSVTYESWQLEDLDTNICTLTRMCVKAFCDWVGKVILGCGLLVMALVALMPLVLLTLALPEGWQVNPIFMTGGMAALLSYVVASIIILAAVTWSCIQGDIPFAPEYITKHFHKNNNTKQKQPSQTWIAVKEMYRSFKEKTCIKVKL